MRPLFGGLIVFGTSAAVLALEMGATVACGGRRTGALLEPTVLENVPVDRFLEVRKGD